MAYSTKKKKKKEERNLHWENNIHSGGSNQMPTGDCNHWANFVALNGPLEENENPSINW